MNTSFPATNPSSGVCSYSSNSRNLVAIIRQLLTGFKISSDGRINLNGWTDSRAASLWLPDHEGIIREVPPGVPAIIDPNTGRTPRIVRNLFSDSEPNSLPVGMSKVELSGGTVTYNGDGTVTFYAPVGGRAYFAINPLDIYGYALSISMDVIAQVGTDSKQFVYALNSAGGNKEVVGTNNYAGKRIAISPLTKSGTYLRIGVGTTGPCTSEVSITLTKFQIEDLTGSADITNPSEYVSTHGVADGIAYYATSKANTVGVNGVVTESSGAQLPSYGEWGFVHYPSTTNLLKKSSDFTLDGVAWIDYTSGKVSTVQSSNRALDNNFKYDVVANNTIQSTYYINSNTTSRGAVQTEYTARINVTPGTVTWTRIQIAKSNGSKRAVVWFNLTGAGSVGSTESTTYTVTDYSITQEPDGSYTLTVSAITDSVAESDRLTIYPVSMNGSSVIQPATIGEVLMSVAMAQMEAHPFATPVVPTTGAPVMRDMCSLRHNYTGYFNQSEGTLVLDWVPLHDAYSRTYAQHLFTTDMLRIHYLGTSAVGKFNATDGTKYPNVTPPTPYVSGDNIRSITRWSVSLNELQPGVLNADNADGWKWGNITGYDGEFERTVDLLHLFKDMKEIAVCKSLIVYNKVMSTTDIEALP